MVVIIDYRMGNVGSIRNMLRRVGADSVVSADPSVISQASHLILPGVGAFDEGMANLERLNLLGVLNERTAAGIPILGICLGMQLLTRKSEEGVLPGLGWLSGETVRFRIAQGANGHKVPHMGWNNIGIKRFSSLFDGLSEEDARFYFVHSYHLVCEDDEDVLATTRHGYDFPSAVGKGNILGTQFHPEKSHKFGMLVLKNFVERCHRA